MRGGYRRAHRTRLLRAARQYDARKEGVAVVHLHALDRQADPFGRDLRVDRGSAHAHLVGGDAAARYPRG